MEIRSYNGHEIHPGSPVYERLVKQEKFLPYTDEEIEEYSNPGAAGEDLDSLSKADLAAKAEKLGVVHTGTKTQILDAIRNAEASGDTLE